jgi:S-(hydroxymethyl)glutathione dehydrogenase/alcohol dehydrogenase|tara:strand:- start:622 stop:1662 length:1041 start_codon:yes stop_codon:yes gene_type:complete
MTIIKAAVLTEIKKPLEIKTLKMHVLEPGQVLVKILFSGVCRSQLMEIKGMRGEDPWLPHLLGHEGSGIVIRTGPGVKKVKAKDAVILTWIKGNGMEGPGAEYDHEGIVIHSGMVTTFSNYSIVSENRLIKKPKNLAFDTAILYGCALPTGAGMVLNELNISAESSVIVIGLGGIGLSAVAMLLSLGVNDLMAIDISDEKLKEVKSWGVSHVINANKPNFKELVNGIMVGGVDYCIESAGKISTIELGFSLIKKRGGKLLFASHPPEGESIALPPHELISGKQIAGSWGGGVMPDKDIPIIYKNIESSNIPISKLLSKPYSLEEINQALGDLENGKVFRPLIKMEH